MFKLLFKVAGLSEGVKIATIGAAATVGAAVIANWDKIRPVIHELTKPSEEKKA